MPVPNPLLAEKVDPHSEKPKEAESSWGNETVQPPVAEGKPGYLSKFPAWAAYTSCLGPQKILAHPSYPLPGGKHAQKRILPHHILLGKSSKL